MHVHHYETLGGKDVIVNYIDKLSKEEIIDAYSVIAAFKDDKLDNVVTRQWRGKIWEAYFYKSNRFFYVIVDGNDAFFLHACRKQKNKTERNDAEIVVKRAKELGKKLSRDFV